MERANETLLSKCIFVKLNVARYAHFTTDAVALQNRLPNFWWWPNSRPPPGLVSDQSTHPYTEVKGTPHRPIMSLLCVKVFMQENSRRSIFHRAQELGLSQTSLWQILPLEFGVHLHKSQLTSKSKLMTIGSVGEFGGRPQFWAKNHLQRRGDTRFIRWQYMYMVHSQISSYCLPRVLGRYLVPTRRRYVPHRKRHNG